MIGNPDAPNAPTHATIMFEFLGTVSEEELRNSIVTNYPDAKCERTHSDKTIARNPKFAKYWHVKVPRGDAERVLDLLKLMTWVSNPHIPPVRRIMAGNKS